MRRALLLLAAVAVAVAAVTAATYTLTASDVTSMQAAIKTKFGMGNSFGTACAPCTLGDNYGALVRLIFHDAAGGGGPNGEGGMNGCIDFTQSDHKGLEEVVGQLDSIYTPFASKISKADFWLLAANLAIQYASTTNTSANVGNIANWAASPGTLYLPFKYGRVDDATCDDADRLPSAGFNFTQMRALFQTRLGLSLYQTVAIMGAHSLGRAQFANSGFEGGWIFTQSSFTNFYFTFLGGVKWDNTNSSNVWVDTVALTKPIMLTVDVEPLFSPASACPSFRTFTTQGATAGCANNAVSASIVTAYASSISNFYSNYSAAWQVLTQFEYTDMQLADVGTAIPTATAVPTTATPTTAVPTTAVPTTATPTTAAPSTVTPTTATPTTTDSPTTAIPTTDTPTTATPTTDTPTTAAPTTAAPTTATPTTATPTTATPTGATGESSTATLSATNQSIVIGVISAVCGVLLVVVLLQGIFYYRRRGHKAQAADNAYAKEMAAVKTDALSA